MPSLHPCDEQAEQKTSSFCGRGSEGARCRPKTTWRRVPSTQPGAGHGTQASSPAHTSSNVPGPTRQVSVLPQVACQRRRPHLGSVGAQEQVHKSSRRRRSTGALPRRLGAAGNRGFLCGPHRPAPAHLGARCSEPSPGCHSPCTVWSRPPGVATSPGAQDWCITRNLILCVPGLPSPPCLFVTLRPCHRVRERSLCGPHPAGVRSSWGLGGAGGWWLLGGHVEIEERSPSRSDPEQVRVLRLGPA